MSGWTDGPGAQLDYVTELLADEIGWRTRRRDRDRRQAFTLQLSTVSLSALITVLLGLRVGEPLRGRLADVALVLGALITVLAAWSAFFAHRALWIQRSETVHRLAVLRRRIGSYRAKLGESAPEQAEVDEYLAEYERILDSDHRSWIRIRQSQESGQAG